MFKKYQRKNLAEMRDLLPEETKTALKNKKVSISQPDMELSDYDFSLGKVARNPDNPADMWYVAKDYFEKNFAESDNGQLDLLVIPKIAEPREDDFVNTVTQTILAWNYEDGDINNLINTLIEKDIKNLFSDWQEYTEELSNFSA